MSLTALRRIKEPRWIGYNKDIGHFYNSEARRRNYMPEKYSFDQITDRRGTFSEKWNVTSGELPMWVADMDFKTAPEIIEAIQRKAAHGIFGYTTIPEEWFKAYIGWWKRRHRLDVKREWLSFSTGVIPAISSIIRTLTEPGEKVLVQPPVYNIFFHCIISNGRETAENELVLREGKYSVDFEDLEQKLSDPKTTLMLLCNPQNPSGTLWDTATLGRIGELCKRYGVPVISDEIHCDLTDPGFTYTPFASVSETCRDISITCIAPTKAFNLAGIHTAAVLIPNAAVHRKVRRGLNRDEVAAPGAFAIDAVIAAYGEGEEWLDALREYIKRNKEILSEFISEELPEIPIVQDHATYLVWLDCRKVAGEKDDIADEIRRSTGLYISRGGIYGNAGKGFVRMNLAYPGSVLYQGLERLRTGVRAYANKTMYSK